MTVASELARNEYNGDDIAVDFTVGFYFLINADIRAVLYNSVTEVETELVEITHYTLVGAGEAAGGTLTMITTPTSDETLTILRELALIQGRDYIEHNNFPAESHEQALDRLTMLQQQLNEKFIRTVRFQPSATEKNIKMESLIANKVILISPTADKLIMGPNGDEIESAQTYATAAETAKTAAETAQTAAETAQTAAELAKTAAELAETAAELAETNAETAEANAVIAKTAAETAQTAAVTAKTAAETAQTAAETAETNAIASATAAAASESAAAASESAAAASESAAAASAAAAAASAASLNIATPVASKEGAILVQNALDDGYDLLETQGTAGQVLTSAGANVKPSFQTKGDVTAAANLDANEIVIGEDGTKGVKKGGASITDAGIVTLPNQSGAMSQRDAVQSMTNADNTIIQWNSELWDTQNEQDMASTWRFTAIVAGIYQVDCVITLASAAWDVPEYLRTSLFKNNVRFMYGLQNSTEAAVTTIRGAGLSLSIKLAINDYVDIRFYHDQGAAVNLQGGNQTYFSIHKIA